MASVAKTYRHVVGIDTHAANHHLAIVAAATGELVTERGFPATGKAITRALEWVGRRTGAELEETLVVIEGIGSYGAQIAARAEQEGYQVVEAPRVPSDQRHGRGKSDAIDAELIATTVLPTQTGRLRQARRADGTIGALRVLSISRRQLTGEKTRKVNALTALLRTHDLGIEATRELSTAKIRQVAAWRPRPTEDVALATARHTAIGIARSILQLHTELTDNNTQMLTLIKQTPGGSQLLAQVGIGPVTAAAILAAYSHHGRLHSEAAFAAIAGTNPIPASSGNTDRHRLNRGGDRQLNSALYTIVLTRLSHDPTTADYLHRLMTDPHRPKTKKEAIRIIKRRLARSIYRLLNQLTAPEPLTSHLPQQAPAAA